MQLLWPSHVYDEEGETGWRVDRIAPNSDICQFQDSACLLWIDQLPMTTSIGWNGTQETKHSWVFETESDLIQEANVYGMRRTEVWEAGVPTGVFLTMASASGGWLLWLCLGTHEPGCWHWPWHMTPTMASWLNIFQWLFSRISAWKYPQRLEMPPTGKHSIPTQWLRSLGSVDLNWPPFAGQGRRRDKHRLRKQTHNAGHIPDFCLPPTLHLLRLWQPSSRSWSFTRWLPVLLSGFL